MSHIECPCDTVDVLHQSLDCRLANPLVLPTWEYRLRGLPGVESNWRMRGKSRRGNFVGLSTLSVDDAKFASGECVPSVWSAETAAVQWPYRSASDRLKFQVRACRDIALSWKTLSNRP